MQKSYGDQIGDLKDSGKKFLLRQLANWLANTSNNNLMLIAGAAEKMAYGQPAKNVIAQFKELIKSDHPSIGLVRRILKDTDVNCRNKLIDCLIIDGLIMNQRKKLASSEQGQAVPTTILISPTMRCNLSCIGCYAGNYSKADDLPVETFERLISEAKALGVSFFTILGGEPFFYPALLDVVKNHPDLYFQIYTNGTLIDAKLADQIKALGNILPVISIEGYEKETDERRGAGTYDNVMRAMDILHERKIPFGFSAAVTNKNVEIISSDEFIDFMIKKGAYLGWFFLYMPVGKNPDLSLMPTPEQRAMLLERDEHIRQTKPLFIVDFWNDAPFVGGCIAGKEYIHVTSKGDVEPCIFTHFAVDNIKDKSLAEVMNSEFFKDLRRRQPYNDNLFLPCMWIDNPEVSREVIAKYQAYPTHEGADDVLVKDDLKAGIDDYSARVKEIYGKIWSKRQPKN